MKTFTPIEENKVHGGVQKVYRFENGYGASVIRHMFSYGGEVGLWEVAVLSGPNQELDYTTPITDDVLGRLSDEQVAQTLAAIDALPKKQEAQ